MALVLLLFLFKTLTKPKNVAFLLKYKDLRLDAVLLLPF
jgi:hypothetical protein